MITCINCGSPNAWQGGDVLSCPDCGYLWDTQHEQQNAAYLATQGRKPVSTVTEVGETYVPAGADLSYMTVAQLRELAVENGIELASDARKADIVATIKAALES